MLHLKQKIKKNTKEKIHVHIISLQSEFAFFRKREEKGSVLYDLQAVLSIEQRSRSDIKQQMEDKNRLSASSTTWKSDKVTNINKAHVT